MSAAATAAAESPQQATAATTTARPGAGNRISRLLYTHVLDFTPHIPSICIGCASPALRYSREAIAGMRVQHEEKHRGDLYLCREADDERARLGRRGDPHRDTGSGGGLGHFSERGVAGSWRRQEFHRLEGVLEHIVSDLELSGWWLGRRLSGSGKMHVSTSAADFHSLDAEAKRAVVRQQNATARAIAAREDAWSVSEDVVPLEIDIKRVADPADMEAMVRSVTALLKRLASPPFQDVQGSVVVSCLRSLIFTPRQLSLGDETGCLPLLHCLPLLTKLESFAKDFGCLGPQLLPCLCVVKIRNASIASLDCLRGQHNVQLLDISRCSRLQDVSALSELRNLRELSISNSRELSMAGDFSPCTQLTTVSLTWCRRIQHIESILAAPNLANLSLSYSRVDNIAALLDDACCSGPGLCSLVLRGCADSSELLDALPERDDDAPGKVNEGNADAKAERPTARTPRALSRLEHIDLGESQAVDDHRLSRLVHQCPMLRSLSVRECPAVRSLSSLSSVADSLEAVDASYTQVSDINGLATCRALRRVTLRDCFRLKNMAPLAKVADSLEEVDASMSTQAHVWSRDAQADSDAYLSELFSPKLMHSPVAEEEECARSANASNAAGGGSAETTPVAAEGLTQRQKRITAERAALLSLLISPLQPTPVLHIPPPLQAGGIW